MSDGSTTANDSQVSSTALLPRTRRRLVAAAVSALVLLLLIVTPPLLKLNRYARGISLSMSESLGRPVHLDNVSLGLLPQPHLTLQNVVVSEDPAFGSEPTIRANVVEANLRPSSLWRRPMEFSRVRFVEPSVNLVRNADGHWNLEGVLVHASQVNTAPTAQQHRGPAPRFPYIEATGGRVNIKLADEKKPFSLLDTDFALWLPSPEQWSIRLNGTPARTDTNLSDPGVLRVEGSLQRAAHMNQVPVDLRLSWRNAQLGAATRLFSGGDQGWRGTVQVDAALKGSLGAGRLGVDWTVDDLRRADFVPVHDLSLHLHCVALADVPAAALRDLACALPAGGAQPLRLQAETVDLVHPLDAGVTLEAEATPLEWWASWARLFSPRFPATFAPGTLDGTLSRGEGSRNPPGSKIQSTATPITANTLTLPATAAPLSGWLGSVTVHLPAPSLPLDGPVRSSAITEPATGSSESKAPQESPRSQTLTAEVVPGTDGESWRLTLPPSPLRLSADASLVVSGSATPAGYSVRATGQTSPASLVSFAQRLPPLADHLPAALAPTPGSSVTASAPAHVDVTCSRAWNSLAGDQACIPTAEPARKPRAFRPARPSKPRR